MGAVMSGIKSVGDKHQLVVLCVLLLTTAYTCILVQVLICIGILCFRNVEVLILRLFSV
jgi:hypothetical protein